MNLQDKEKWIKECKRLQKEKGYVPAEMQLLPLLVSMIEKGVLTIIDANDLLIEDNNKKRK